MERTDKRRSGCATPQIADFPCANGWALWLFTSPKIDLRDNDLFFLLTSCSHLPAYEPALSKESIESNHVNTPSKSGLRSHFCTYFLGLILQKNRYKFSRIRPKRAADQHFIHIFGQSTEIKQPIRINRLIRGNQATE